jgi:hypothetical protein
MAVSSNESPLTLSLSPMGRGNAVATVSTKSPLPSGRGWGEGGIPT